MDRDTGRGETLSVKNAERELDLVEARGVQRQEHRAHPVLLVEGSLVYLWVAVNREIVDRHDKEPLGPPSAGGLQ